MTDSAKVTRRTTRSWTDATKLIDAAEALGLTYRFTAHHGREGTAYVIEMAMQKTDVTFEEEGEQDAT